MIFFNSSQLRRHFKWPLAAIWTGLALYAASVFVLSPYSTFHDVSTSYLNYPLLSMASSSLLALLALIPPMRKFLKSHPIVGAGFWVLVVLVFLSYQIVLATNIIFDTSPSKKIDVWVKQKVAYTGKGAHLTLLLSGPQIDYQRQILNVRPEVFDHVKLGEQISLSVHTGALGLLWFDGSWSKVPIDEKRP